MECLLEVSLCLRREFVLYLPKLESALYGRCKMIYDVVTFPASVYGAE